MPDGSVNVTVLTVETEERAAADEGIIEEVRLISSTKNCATVPRTVKQHVTTPGTQSAPGGLVGDSVGLVEGWGVVGERDGEAKLGEADGIAVVGDSDGVVEGRLVVGESVGEELGFEVVGDVEGIALG